MSELDVCIYHFMAMLSLGAMYFSTNMHSFVIEVVFAMVLLK